MFGLTFTSLAFLAAGTACAAGPIIIHLLNRRRYKVVQWAAMDFLRQAMQRNRRILQIRDIILLVLRTAAVFLFGLALARPFFASRQEEFDDRQPLHAVIVVDNSLSMGYESLEGTLLDKAKDRARQLIDKLPAGSRMSIIPACGSSEAVSPDPYDTKENALEALSRIEIVDRTATLQGAANVARTASKTSQLAKRVVFISDQQKLNWQDHQASTFEDLPMQVVDVAPADWENTWISDLRVQDGLADVETPTTIVVELRHHGPSARRDVQVTLSMGDTVIGEKSVTIEPGLGSREIDFEYVFNSLTDLPEPDKPIFVPLKAAISPDRLAADDARYLAVPVVASLPVVFIDQYGPEQEDAIKGRLGETRHLRKLLAPKTSRSDAPRQLISVRHITPDELNQDVLADARLVMIAGVQSPQGMVDLLRAYVRQGGRVVIAAGANFDPAAWNDTAWLDGAGILPLPLDREPIGEVPEVAGANLKPFSLNFDSLKNGGYFQLANVPEAELQDLYAEPFFFKAVSVDASPEAIDRWKQAEMKRLDEELSLKASVEKQKAGQPKETVPSGISEEDREGLESDEERLRELRPAWLTWSGALEAEVDPVLPEDSAERGRMLETLVLTKSPSVLARFDLEDRSPFLVSRKVGRGEVIFCSTGLLSSWNTLPKTNAVLIFDRILRELAQETLPRRNFEATARTTLPLPPQEQNLQATLIRPGSTAEEPLDVNNIGEDQRGVTVTGMLTRGVYRVAGYRQVLSADSALESDKPVWEVPLVVSGPGDESDLTPLGREQFDADAASANLRWIGPAEEISLAGTAIRGQTMWWWLALLVLLLLLVEMTVLAWPSFRPQDASTSPLSPGGRGVGGEGEAALNMIRTLGWLLGIENATAIDDFDVSLAESWAQDGLFWVILIAVALMILSIVFYLRFQAKGPFGPRLALGVFRGILLALLFVMLADPVLQLTVISRQQPYLYVIFDGTDSMAIEDELPDAQRSAIEKAVDWKGRPPAEPVTTPTSAPVTSGGGGAEQESPEAPPSRMDYVQSLVRKADANLLRRLVEEKKVQLEAFVFEGDTTSKLRKLNLSDSSDNRLNPDEIAKQLSTTGKVTALGSVVHEVNQQFGAGRLAGVVLVSDFAHNSGIAPLGAGSQSPIAKLGAPIYAVGVGATEAVDLAIDLQTDPKMKKAERSSVLVKLRQSGLAGQSLTVRVSAKRMSGESAAEEGEINVGQRTVTLTQNVETIELPFTPEESGRFEFTAVADKLEGEIVDQNNQAARQVNIIDDYLRLMYVAYEPTWEWRFIKEVFHRDKLVGMQGFRTFLSSSDPRVRESNVLFLPTLTPRRSDFFANDVIFLDDMPRASLNDRFTTMLKEYVGNLGGGLVVIAGPRFGPQELHQSPLADMLPVIVDPNAELHEAPDYPEFRPRLTPHAARYPFMQLGASDFENSRAWDNLGRLPWYQPVAALHEQAFSLADHPTDKCADGRTPQPLIAVRQYGKGEVVYLGFNETWRLRRKYGEKYYRQFWSQLIYRLGMSHALGADKRFVARLDQQQYRAEDKVTLTVEAYDANYEPLSDETLPDRALVAELTVPGKNSSQATTLPVPMLRKGVFEVRIPVYAEGPYSLRVKDPVTGKFDEQRFEVTPLSAERRRGVRDDKMQNDLAQQTSGRAYDLTTVHRLPDDLNVEPVIERHTRNFALWSTPLWFGAIVVLMLGEWLSRKLIRLS